MKRTVVGIGDVQMTQSEIDERQIEESLWLAKISAPKDPDPTEVRFSAIEKKLGITAQDKLDAEAALKGDL